MIGEARALHPISQMKIELRSTPTAESITSLHCIWHFDLSEGEKKEKEKRKKRKINRKKQSTEMWLEVGETRGQLSNDGCAPTAWNLSV